MARSIGDRLYDQRRQLRMTQLDVSEKTGISEAAYSKYERDINVPGGLSLVALSHALNVSTDWILGLKRAKN